MKEKFMPLSLQFFADGDAGNDTGNTAGNTGADVTNTNDNNVNNQDESLENDQNLELEKKFSQDEMKRIAAREKRQGKQSVLNSLGVKSEEEAKRIINAYNKFMSAENPQQAKEIQGNSDYDQLQKRVLLAESKLAALSLGVDKDSVDDAIAIANMKAEVSGDEVADVLEDMRKDKKYAGFFVKTQGTEEKRATGTGTGIVHGNAGVQENGELGKELAKRVTSGNKKSSFFKKT